MDDFKTATAKKQYALLKKMSDKECRKALRSISKEQLADVLGVAKAAYADAKNLNELVKDSVKRRGIRHAVGSLFQISVQVIEKTFLDSDKIYDKMGEKWWNKHAKSTEYKAVYCNAKN